MKSQHCLCVLQLDVLLRVLKFGLGSFNEVKTSIWSAVSPDLNLWTETTGCVWGLCLVWVGSVCMNERETSKGDNKPGHKWPHGQQWFLPGARGGQRTGTFWGKNPKNRQTGQSEVRLGGDDVTKITRFCWVQINQIQINLIPDHQTVPTSVSFFLFISAGFYLVK